MAERKNGRSAEPTRAAALPLSNVTVVAVEQAVAAPYASRLLADWGARHRESSEPPRHDACGTPVEARWWCPTCEQPIDEDEAGGLHFA